MSGNTEDLRETSETNARSSRRKLITGGALAAGAAAGGVLLGAAPNANAANGDPIRAGQGTHASATTKLSGGPEGALLHLANGNASSGAHGLYVTAMNGYGIAGASEGNHGLSGTTTGRDKGGVLAINNGAAGKGAGLLAYGRKNAGAIVNNADSASPALVSSSTGAKPVAFRGIAGTFLDRARVRLTAESAAVQATAEKGTAIHGVGGAFGAGVQGEAFSEGAGVYGISHPGNPAYGGVEGSGHLGSFFWGVGATSTGVVARADVEHLDTSWAISAEGNVRVVGTITTQAAASTVDHPLKPGEKYLSHAFVESPEMKTVHDGVVTANAKGEAVVELPEWFDAVNKDFRYQLTPIGKSAPTLYVQQEVRGNAFRIAGANPGQKVSWQLTGVRKDAWAEKNRVQVERDKSGEERGRFLFPEGFGKDKSKRLSPTR